MMKNLALIFLIYYSTHSIASKQLYGVEDLSILANQNSFIEFFDHAHDIIPSQRDPKWNEMVESMGLLYLDSLRKKPALEDADLKVVKSISKWPIFIKNEFFIKKRDFYFIKLIKHCFQAKQKHCSQLTENIYNQYKHDIEFSFDLATTLSSFGIEQEELWKYTIQLVQHELSEFYCHKEPLKSIVLNKLFTLDSKGAGFEKDLVHKDCIKSLLSDIQKVLSSTNNQSRLMAFKLLKNYGYLKSDDVLNYNVLNFLASEELSHKDVDEALKGLKVMERNYNRRKIFIDSLQNQNYLPDKIFSNNKNFGPKTRLLNRYFPEYIDLYAKTCLDYLNSDQSFAKGNPTPKCHEFFKQIKPLNILPDSFHSRYEKATYFTKPNNRL